MIEEGVLENPKVENVFGQHTLPTLEAGKLDSGQGNIWLPPMRFISRFTEGAGMLLLLNFMLIH